MSSNIKPLCPLLSLIVIGPNCYARLCYGVPCENCSFQMKNTFFLLKVYPSICIGCINRAESVGSQRVKLKGLNSAMYIFILYSQLLIDLMVAYLIEKKAAAER